MAGRVARATGEAAGLVGVAAGTNGQGGARLRRGAGRRVARVAAMAPEEEAEQTGGAYGKGDAKTEADGEADGGDAGGGR